MSDDADQAQRFEAMRRQIGLRSVLAQARRQNAEREPAACSACGDPIEPERLAACPGARRCLDCQQHVETHSRLFPRGDR